MLLLRRFYSEEKILCVLYTASTSSEDIRNAHTLYDDAPRMIKKIHSKIDSVVYVL